MRHGARVILRALCLLVLLLPGCGAGSDGGGRTVLMWSFAQNNVDEWKARQADIEKKFNIKLQIEVVAQNAFVQKLQAVMSDGKGIPDVIEWMIENNRILNADPKKCFVYPLDTYVSASSVFPNVPAGRVAWVKYGGHVYGLPHDVHPVVLVYNDTLWKEVGVDMETINTWDEFFEAAKKLTAKKAGGKPVHYALPYGDDGLNNTMFMIWQQTGSQILDGEGKPAFTDPAFKGFLEKWLGWKSTGAFTAWDWGNFAALLKNGTLASYTSPDWYVPQIDDAAKDGKYQFRARPMPLYAEGGPRTASWGGSFLAIPKTAKNPEFLYKIMEYMQYDPSAAKSRYTTGMLPPLAAVWDDPVFKQEDPRFGGQKLGELQIALAKEMPAVNSGDVFWDAINDFTQQYTEIAGKRITVDEGLQRTQDAVLKRIK
jgi:arabinosaccharide transport system substrate-binding protein